MVALGFLPAWLRGNGVTTWGAIVSNIGFFIVMRVFSDVGMDVSVFDYGNINERVRG